MSGESTTANGRMSRRAVLKTGAALATTTLAGCFVPPPFESGRGGGDGPITGNVPGGAPAKQELTAQDADVVATTAEDLIAHIEAADGRIVWLPPGNTYDLSGRSVRLSNITLASGRNGDQMGATITTSDQGASSHAWNAGDGKGLITCGDNVRITGVSIKGPHTQVTDHPVISGYFPFAPGDEDARDRWRRERFARAITIYGNNVSIDNCDIWGFGVQGISIGRSGNAPENVSIRYCSITNCMMTSYGYAIDVRHGHPTIYRCYFDATRHSICGSGMADCGYSLIECTFGPWTSSHQIDMHRVGNNSEGSRDPDADNYRYRAGNTMYVRDCILIPTHVPDLPFINHNRGGMTPHVAVRGVPLDGFYMEGCACAHETPDDGVNQSGISGRYTPDENGYVNINLNGNQWGVQFEDGAPAPPSPNQPNGNRRVRGQAHNQDEVPVAAVREGWGEPLAELSSDFRNGSLENKWSQWGDGEGCKPVDTWHGHRCGYNSQVHDGMHAIEGTPDGTSGGATSTNTFTYIRIEIRERAYAIGNYDAEPYNVVPLIYPRYPDSKIAGDGEMDFAERKVGETPFFVIHWNDDNYYITVDDLDGTKWHNYAIEWQPNRISWYIDGQFVASHDVSVDIEAEYNAGQMDMLEEGKEMQHNRYEIDWIKVYSPDANGPSPVPQNDHPGGTDWVRTENNVHTGINEMPS